MPVFPAIANPVGAGYKETPPDNGLRTPMDVGPAKTRRRTTANARNLSVMHIISAADEATLDAFYATVGTYTSFTYTHPRTLAAVTVRFLSPPEYGWQEGRFTAALSLEVLPS